MSRVIKFRLWGFGLKPPRYRTMHDVQLFNHNGSLGAAFDQFTDSPLWAVEQFTGLKDCNGVDIYEGDIIDSRGIEKDFWPNLLVVWEHMGFAARHVVYSGEWRMDVNDAFVSRCVDQYKVIGNLHQNPDLLK